MCTKYESVLVVVGKIVDQVNNLLIRETKKVCDNNVAHWILYQ